MVRDRARALVLAFATLAMAPVASAARVGSASDPREALARLESQSASVREASLAELIAMGEDAALAALEDLGSRDVLSRRLCAWIVYETGGTSAVEPALASLGDPDARTREWLVAFLGQTPLRDFELARRIDALAERARSDADLRVRQRAWTALADLGQPAVLERLDRWFDELAPPEQMELLLALLDGSSTRAWLRARVMSSFSDAPGAEMRLAPELAEPLLSGYARALAELPSGGELRAERLPFLASIRHHDPRLRAAGARGFDLFMRRLVALGDAARAQRILSACESDGFDRRAVQYQRARVAFLVGDDPKQVVELARALSDSERVLGGIGDRAVDPRGESTSSAGSPRDLRDTIDGERERGLWFVRACQLLANAHLVTGDLDLARDALARAGDLVFGLLAERTDLEGKSGAGIHEQLLHDGALIEVLSAVERLARAIPASGSTVDPEAVQALEREAVGHAGRAHDLELEAQGCAWRAGLSASKSWDALLRADLSPLVLVFDNPHWPAWPAERSFAVRVALGRALASVAPREMPGFEPLAGIPPDRGEVLHDPRRLELLRRAQIARHDALRVEFNTILRRMREVAVEELAGPDPDDQLALIQIEQELSDALESIQKGAADGWRGLEDLRVPSSYGLWLARDLRADGRTVEARTLADAVRAALESSGQAQRYIWGLEFLAEIEMTIGSSFTDDDQPERAERELLQALDRLEGIENLIRERGFGPGEIGFVKSLRCSTLVSLAVNANVKLGDQDKALAYFERAFELRQDDFMRVLLACYRARSGRTVEARAILRDVTPSPGTLYNIACTWALLGERELALDFLRRDFDANLTSPGARAKQREWARKDPDLRSLWEDPAFQEILGS